MKTCPVCRTTYDNSMVFCFEDGAVLVNQRSNQPSNSKTEILFKPDLPETVFIPTAIKSETPLPNQEIEFSLEPSTDKRNINLVFIVLTLLGLCVGVVAVSYFLFDGRSGREITAADSHPNANAPTTFKPDVSNKSLFPNSGSNRIDNSNSEVSQNAANTKAKPTQPTNINRSVNRNANEKSNGDAPTMQRSSPAETSEIVSGGVVNGKATNLVKPAYPAAAKAVRASGAVIVRVLIDENGNVISASAISGHALLQNTAVSAARQSKFSPTVVAGRKVKVKGVIVYNFEQ